MKCRFSGTGARVGILIAAETDEEKILIEVFKQQVRDQTRRRPGIHFLNEGGDGFMIGPTELPPGILATDGRRHKDGCERHDFHERKHCCAFDEHSDIVELPEGEQA